MDFDIGTFIYILLTLVFIIIGSLGKKKRPQVNKPDADADGEPVSVNNTDAFTENFKKLFGEFDDEADIPVAEHEPIVKEEEIKLDTPHEKLDNLKGTLDIPGNAIGGSEIYKIEDHIKDIMENSNILMNQHTRSKSTFVSRALRDFDPKKAWLYSEIFKPKYF
ncbi:MAG: hypothetical protein ACP5E3_04485 [Bacteroidales bacterium]